jgi:acyl dehydratase
MTTERLDSPPSLAPLYARTIAGTALPFGRSDELPDRVVELDGVEVDREHLAAYNRVCGFVLRDQLPPTYPHVLAFPLSMEVMTDRSFPFSLLGMVHVANRIEQRRPLRADERLSVRVRAEDLRPHPRGRQFDLVGEAAVDGETVWASRSTYLRQGGGNGAKPSARDSAPEPPSADEATAVWQVPGDIGRRYAAVSGDRNPIHLHPLSARLLGVKGPIAHGMWMKARCLAAFEGRLPDAFVAEVQFKAPLRIPAEVRFASRAAGEGWSFALYAGDSERPNVTGSISPRP